VRLGQKANGPPKGSPFMVYNRIPVSTVTSWSDGGSKMLYILVLSIRGHGSDPCSTTAYKAPFSFQRGEPS
jgi:hypothetical protein